MLYPFKSLLAGFLIYCLMISLFIFLISQKNEIPQVSITINTEIIGNITQHQQSKKKFKKETDLEKISTAKKLAKKNDEEKLEPNEANSAKDSEHSSNKITTQKITPVYQPLPEIPYDLRFEAFNSYSIARFYIKTSGDVEKVELIKPCNNPKLNWLLLQSLKKWKFPQNNQQSTQEIKVSFKVE
jgi:hypothetical protein